MPKIFITVLMLTASISAWAKPYLVLEWTANTRIVLSEDDCMVSQLEGKAAAIQRTDGAVIRGCWQFVNEFQHVRIDWDNPNHPNDFAVFRFGDFKIVEYHK